MCLRNPFLSLACILNVAVADQWISPRTIDLISENGEWAAKIQPETERQTFSPAESRGFATATIAHKGKSLQFELRNEWMPVDAIMLNNGHLLTFDDWHRMGYGDSVAVLYSQRGGTVWHRTLSELITEEKEQQAPHSASSIWWRKTPVEWQYGSDEESVVITLADEHQLAIQLLNGATEFIEVQDVGNHPERLVARARAENRLGNYVKESELLEQVIELAPEDLNAYIALGQSYNRQQLHTHAVSLLTRATERFGETDQEPHTLVNLYCELATAHAPYAGISPTGITMINGKILGEQERQYPNNLEAAEAALRIACLIMPSYNLPYQKLARILETEGREAEIAELLQARYESGLNNTYERERFITDIGNYYKSNHQYAVAANWYEKLYSPTKVSNTFTYQSLAKVYEELEKYDSAIAIHQQLIDYWEAMNSRNIWDRNIQKSKNAITELIHQKQEPLKNSTK